MPVTAADQQKKLILMKVGEHSGRGPVAASIDAIWDMYADKASIPRLQYHYVLSEALDIWLALGVGAQVRVGPRMVTINDVLFENLLKLRKNNQDEIEKLERQYRASHAPTTSSFKTKAPITPASDPLTECAPDPNARRFRGDPLFPSIIR